MSLAKKPSTALSQEAEVGVKWKVQARMPVEPGADLGVLVGGVVVEDRRGRSCRPGPRASIGVEEADELLMPVALHAAADDRAVQHVEGGEQGRRAVALVVVGHGPGTGPSSSAAPAGCGRAPGSGDFSSTDSTTAWAGGST